MTSISFDAIMEKIALRSTGLEVLKKISIPIFGERGSQQYGCCPGASDLAVSIDTTKKKLRKGHPLWRGREEGGGRKCT
jgi:hypothetical protein